MCFIKKLQRIKAEANTFHDYLIEADMDELDFDISNSIHDACFSIRRLLEEIETKAKKFEDSLKCKDCGYFDEKLQCLIKDELLPNCEDFIPRDD